MLNGRYERYRRHTWSVKILFSAKGQNVKQVFVLVGLMAVGSAGCSAGVENALHGFQADSGSGNGSSGSGSGSGGGSGGDPGSSGGGSSGCGACNSGDDATTPSDDASTPGDDASTSSSTSGSSGGSTSGSSSGFMLPPFNFPDTGTGSSSGTTGDADNGCSMKIYVDPVFDCPLQGCMTGP